jgi:hypothetical protein
MKNYIRTCMNSESSNYAQFNNKFCRLKKKMSPDVIADIVPVDR